MARQPIKNRGGAYSAVVDTTGLDPGFGIELTGARGPGMSARPAAGDSTHVGSPPKGTDGFSKFMSGLTGLFKGNPKPKPSTPAPMSSAMEDSLSKKYLGR